MGAFDDRYAHSLPAEADPEDVQKVQHKLENARVKLAKLSPAIRQGREVTVTQTTYRRARYT